MTRAFLLSVTLIVATAWTPTVPAASTQSDPIPHQPLGGASIAPAVVVRGFAPSQFAGVSSDVRGARHWSANIRAVPTSVDFGATIAVRGGTETGTVRTLSSMVVRERRLSSTGDPARRFALTFTPKLVSPSFRVEIWNGSTRVFDAANLKLGSTVLAGNDAICDAFGKEASVAMGICYVTVGTCSSLDDEGRFTWTIRRSAPVRWVIPSMSQHEVIGDQMRIIEETASSPGPVIFRKVNVQGLNLAEVILMDEVGSTTVPDGHLPGQ